MKTIRRVRENAFGATAIAIPGRLLRRRRRLGALAGSALPRGRSPLAFDNDVSPPDGPAAARRASVPGIVDSGRLALSSAVLSKGVNQNVSFCEDINGVRVSKKDVEKYRRSLLAKTDELSQEIGKNKDAGEESAEESTQDIVDKATSSYTKEFLFSLSDNERASCSRSRGRSPGSTRGVFGTCSNCGSSI